jgi:fibronectin-binding autotransporter adhesin
MKPAHNPFRPLIAVLSVTAIAALAPVAFSQTTQAWITGETGAIDDETKYASGIAPVNGDSVTSNGSGSLITFDSTSTVTSLLNLKLNDSSGVSTFTQTSGTLDITGTLTFGGNGGSRQPTYNLNGGTLNATNFTWGYGSNNNLNINGGTMNTGAVKIGTAGGAKGYINMTSGSFTSNGDFSLGHSSSAGTLDMSGGTMDVTTSYWRLGAGSGTTGTMALSGNADYSVSVNGGGTAYMSNNGGTSLLTLSDNAKFTMTGFDLVVGQYNGSATVTVDGGTLTASQVVLGGLNASSSVAASVSLNGGTVVTGAIRKGNSSNNTLNLNGGTVKASAANSNFFDGLAMSLQSGGLTFDTDGNEVGIGNDISGTGAFTKKGAGALTFSGTNTYEGLTTVENGTLVNNGSIAASITVNADGALAGSGTVSGATTVNGTLAIGSSPGSMLFEGDLTLAGIAEFELGGSATAGTDYDHANVIGTLTYGGALDILSHNGYDLATSAAYNLFDAGTTDGNFTSVSVGGLDLTYDGLSDTWSGTSGTTEYSFSESDGVLTVVPEPAAALLGSIGMLILLRRRRG